MNVKYKLLGTMNPDVHKRPQKIAVVAWRNELLYLERYSESLDDKGHTLVAASPIHYIAS